MMIERFLDPDAKGGEVRLGGPGRLLVGGAQDEEAGLLLVCQVPHAVGLGVTDSVYTINNEARFRQNDFKLVPRINPKF